MSQEEQKQARPQTGKAKKFQFDFSTTTDLFISSKGRELRNKQKKLDKIIQTEKSIKKGDIEPTDTQKEMIATKKAVQADIKEVEELVDLYVKSNPGYSRTNEVKQEVKTVNTSKVVEDAFYMAAKIAIMSSYARHNKSVELKEADQTVLDKMISFMADHDFSQMGFNKDAWTAKAQSAAADLSHLVHKKEEFAHLHTVIEEAFQKVPANVDNASAHQQPKAEEAEPEVAVCFSEQATVVAEAKVEQVIDLPAIAETEQAVVTNEESKEAAHGNERGRGGRGGHGGRGRGWRGNGDFVRGEGRGRGGRGGYRNNREDADGFIEETGEKPVRRGRGFFRGERGDRGDRGDRGGNRGDDRGNYRGQRDSARGGARPKDEGTTMPAQKTAEAQPQQPANKE